MSIASEITRLQNAKASIKTSIEGKGVTVPSATTLDGYSTLIDSIPSGGVQIPSTARFGYSKFTDGSFLSSIDYSSNTDFTYMFANARMESMPLIDTSSGNNFSNMFRSSYIKIVNQLDISSGLNISNMFNGCSLLTTIGQLNATQVTNINDIFFQCTALTTLGGFLNLGQAYLTNTSANNNNYKLSLVNSKSLTHDSLMNVINNLYDIATKGCNAQSLALGSTNLAKLTAEEIAIATNKGWTVS